MSSGYQAGTTNVTGYNNTPLGAYAGLSAQGHAVYFEGAQVAVHGAQAHAEAHGQVGAPHHAARLQLQQNGHDAVEAGHGRQVAAPGHCVPLAPVPGHAGKKPSCPGTRCSEQTPDARLVHAGLLPAGTPPPFWPGRVPAWTSRAPALPGRGYARASRGPGGPTQEPGQAGRASCLKSRGSAPAGRGSALCARVPGKRGRVPAALKSRPGSRDCNNISIWAFVGLPEIFHLTLSPFYHG